MVEVFAQDDYEVKLDSTTAETTTTSEASASCSPLSRVRCWCRVAVPRMDHPRPATFQTCRLFTTPQSGCLKELDTVSPEWLAAGCNPACVSEVEACPSTSGSTGERKKGRLRRAALAQVPAELLLRLLQVKAVRGDVRKLKSTIPVLPKRRDRRDQSVAASLIDLERRECRDTIFGEGLIP